MTTYGCVGEARHEREADWTCWAKNDFAWDGRRGIEDDNVGLVFVGRGRLRDEREPVGSIEINADPCGMHSERPHHYIDQETTK